MIVVLSVTLRDAVGRSWELDADTLDHGWPLQVAHERHGVRCVTIVTLSVHSCTCSDRSAIATGRTSDDSVTRHRMIRRRRVCYVKTLAAGRVLSDANERHGARSLASMMNT
jgi:hypothetical protein